MTNDMFSIQMDAAGLVHISGRFDASQVDRARAVLDRLSAPTRVDCADLDYISSAGIGLLLATLKRLEDEGHSFRLARVNDRVMNVLRYAGLDQVFTFE